MSDTLVLATRLRSLGDDALAVAVRRRDVRPGPIKDFFDLAEALLDRESIQQQLTRLDRGTLAAIAAIADITAKSDGGSATVTDVADRLTDFGRRPRTDDLQTRIDAAVDLFLIAPDEGGFTTFDSVADQLRSWPAFSLPGLEDLASDPPPKDGEPLPETEARIVDRLASERAFSTTTEITELLLELEREPARELTRGGIALPDTKRLANAMAVDLERVPRRLRIADRAGLVAREAGLWMITDAGGSWLLEGSSARWRALTGAWHDRLPADIGRMLADRGHAQWGDGLEGFIQWLYPAGGEWMAERIAEFTGDAEAMGITANQAPSGPGSLLLSAGPDAAASAMGELLPREVDKVYLQHDLSVVAPGPLTAGIDYRLRSLADVESRALASSYRISAATVNRAMASGETADSLREFLATISLTGIPQPLDYLITEGSARYGLLRAGTVAENSGEPNTDDWTARSYLRSDDVALLGTVAVDQNLSALGLTRVGEHRIVSRYPLDTVFWLLSDARYPVAAENGGGDVIVLRRVRHARPAPAGVDPVDDLIDRLRLGGEAEPEEAEEAWLARQLDVAVRGKAPITVSVRMPNGSIVDYQLEPTSVAGGRLRARDRRADIERTLPLSSIAGIKPAADPA